MNYYILEDDGTVRHSRDYDELMKFLLDRTSEIAEDVLPSGDVIRTVLDTMMFVTPGPDLYFVTFHGQKGKGVREAMRCAGTRSDAIEMHKKVLENHTKQKS